MRELSGEINRISFGGLCSDLVERLVTTETMV